ncbi:MAG: tetratricopeptide repeat protein [Gemmatimonadetes bacterium]|nr:tetratricopeptide repeat protein [Gemmatimonadota bacterium]
MTASDLQRWSRDVAEDPGSPSFVPLARAYRRQGRRDAALSVVLRGLERNPEHVDAHALLALLHVDAGDRERAGDEWEMILRLDPRNFDARRGLGFLALERGDLANASTHLNAAAESRSGDPTVTQALEVLARRKKGGQGGAAPAAVAVAPLASPAPTPAVPAADDGRRDPTRLFDPLGREAPFLGALLLDGRGLVLAGSMTPAASGDGEALGALLSPAVDEAMRTVQLLGMGGWEGVMLECEGAALHLAPAGDGVLVLAARTGAPAGWVVRAASRARDLARGFLEETG